MGKGVLIAGLVLGILGMLWSYVVLAITLVFTVLGATGEFLVIPVLGFILGIAAIAGGAVGSKWTRAGAGTILGAGAALVLATIIIVLYQAGATLAGALGFSIVAAWWGYGLIIAGALGLVGARGGESRAAP